VDPPSLPELKVEKYPRHDEILKDPLVTKDAGHGRRHLVQSFIWLSELLKPFESDTYAR
jgi:hypothetical protein